jgi:hypothetical protein
VSEPAPWAGEAARARGRLDAAPVKWAVGALTQSRRHLSGQGRSVELAVLGRLAAEMEYELLDLIERPAA